MSTLKNSLLFFALHASTFALTAQNLLPLPQQITTAKGYFDTHRPYLVETKTDGCPSDEILWHTPTATRQHPSATSRRLIFESNPPTLPNEAYQIQIARDTIRINAHSKAGFFYAQRTLEQLVNAKGKIACGRIEDAPAFSWRGAMIDVSRHFYPIDFLKKQIEVMSRYKLNRLHLHLTDAAGWRIEIKRYPRLTRFAAWRTDSLWKTWWNGDRHYVEAGTPKAYGGFYTQAELKDLVDFAQKHQITIIPEIEMPAHSEEVLTAYPELSCTHEPYRQADFCPGNIATYDFLEHVLEEVMAIFPSPYIHVGGDEAGKASWGTCPRCQQKMKEENLTEVKELQTYLIRRIGDFLQRHGRQLIGWDEIIDEQLTPGTHVMIWRDPALARKAVEQGYDVILSPSAHCYLDAYQDDPSTQAEAIGGFLPLEKVYQWQPLRDLPLTATHQVKGVQGNLWTEYVPSTAHAEYMLYPRLLAIAEIGWQGESRKDFANFRQRAELETRRLRESGVNAFDLSQEVGDRKGTQQPLRHLALEAKITYNRPVSPYYPGKSPRTLIDGWQGGWNYGDGRWQGFIGKECFDVTLDLQRVQTVRQITTDFLQCSRPDIFFPATYRISVSLDGTHFRTLYERQQPTDLLPLVATEEWGWKGKAKVRYLRIQAGNGPKGGWIFADEIKVF